MNTHVRLVFRLSIMEFHKRHLGTLLGAIWSLLSPLLTITLIYFVFTFGLKTGTMGSISFINWLVPGMLVWFFMNESIASSSTAIIENSHLVTKVVFPVHILPISKIFAGIPAHVFLMTVFLLLLLYEGDGVAVHTWWQLGYYLFCAMLLCTAISLITSSCMVFVRDTQNMVVVFLQILFWATPIFWNPSLVAATRLKSILLSPFNYIVQGYRDSLFDGVYFWEKPVETSIFWIVVLLITIIGQQIFHRTRPHFADVL